MPETTLSQSAFYSARPTLRVAGQPDARAAELLLSMRMEEDEGGMSRCELRFANIASTTQGGAEEAFASRSTLGLGAEVGVYAGDVTQPIEILRGKVTALEVDYKIADAPEFRVLVEDALQSARMARRSRIYSDKSPADVVNEVASGLGLTPTITGLTSPTDTWAQLNESDLAFLRRLLARFDADLQLVGAELQVSPRGEVRRGAIDLTLFSQLARARVIADLADQVSSVTTSGWDPAQGSKVSHAATQATHVGPGTGKKGKDWLTETLGERSEHVGHLVVSTDAEARAVAEAAFDQRARRFVRIEGLTEGNAKLRVGTHVAISGMSARWDNTYYVVHACHLFDQRQGYRTEFRGECAFLGAG
jgi:phage protein D